MCLGRLPANRRMMSSDFWENVSKRWEREKAWGLGYHCGDCGGLFEREFISSKDPYGTPTCPQCGGREFSHQIIEPWDDLPAVGHWSEIEVQE
jgi:DNA-directed RNA polymerase subunit RPC12/RpoP